MKTSAHLIPHDAKRDSGSEDGYIVHHYNDAFFLCVADGVGGWSSNGVEVRLFTEELMREVVRSIEKGHMNPEIIISDALNHTMNAGSATVSFVVVKNDMMIGYQIGDCGIMVLRNGRVFFETEPQQHSFNHPYQIGRTESGSFHGESPSEGHFYRIPLSSGDVIILGSDGLFDNLTSTQIINTLKADLSADSLAQKAYAESKKTDNIVPFFREAHKEGATHSLRTGGKQDDITVVVSLIQ